MSTNAADQYMLNWDNHTNHLRKAFGGLFSTRDFVDVTFSCEGKKIWAHKMLLSACSSYFYDLFKDHPCQHPIIIMKGVKHEVLLDLLKFIYLGEVSVSEENFDVFLKTAEMFKISGLIQDNPSTKETAELDAERIIEETEEIGNDDSTINDMVPVVPIEKRYSDEFIKNLIKKPIENVRRKKRNGHHGEEKRSKKEKLSSKTEYVEVDLQKDFDSDTFEEAEAEEDIRIAEPHENRKQVIIPNVGGDVFINNVSEGPQSYIAGMNVQCEMCDKTFSHPYSLKHHMHVHRGETECPVCHVILSRKYHLKLHLMNRHKILT